MNMHGTTANQLLKLKALSDETRLDILNLLSSGPLCACDILESFQITQPTLSYHMKLLTESSLVSSEKAGKWTYYALNHEEMDALLEYLKTIATNRSVPLVSSNARCNRDNAGRCE